MRGSRWRDEGGALGVISWAGGRGGGWRCTRKDSACDDPRVLVQGECHILFYWSRVNAFYYLNTRQPDSMGKVLATYNYCSLLIF